MNANTLCSISRMLLPMWLCMAHLATVAQDSTAISYRDAIWSFTFYDQNDEPICLDQYKGKVLLLDFWYTGCTACSYFYQHTLFDVEAALSQEENIVFISIAADPSRQLWTTSVNGGKYTSVHAVNLYTGDLRFNHPMLKHYGINRFPTIVVIDRQGEIHGFYNSAKKPSSAEFTALLIALIRED